jgi:hypothetical protein
VWHLFDAQQSVLARNWPGFVPVAPSSPAVGTVTLGSGTLPLLLTATIPFTQGYNGGNAVTRVTAISIPGNITANTSGSSPITISGLGSNTNYTFAVYETNFYGDSPFGYSNPVTTASVPGAPTIGTVTLSGATASVPFTAPANTGGTPITSYTAVSSPGNITATGTTSPISVPGLSGSTTYTFTVYATNLVGDGPASSASNSVTTGAFYNINYLSVAGGGGGGGGNANISVGTGGGAGGLLTGTFSASPGTVYTATIGAGGTAGSFVAGGNGGNSTLTGITAAVGGGGGVTGNGPGFFNGVNGGSGSGAAYTGTAGSGTSGQGNSGGAGAITPNYGSGGGGGAGGAGSAGTTTVGGNGGAGTSSSITGTSVGYAGGGGGGIGYSGSGGSATSGGGAGAVGVAGAGTANTGGGGGGGGGNGSTNGTGGTGGSGVIILSVPTASYSGTVTGSPTVTTSGSNTIIKFTGNGTYTA